MAVSRRIAAACAFTAALSMSASSLAAELPAAAAPPMVYAGEKAEGHGWYPYGYRRDRVRTSDVLAGVVILGTIAAIASAANKNNRDRDYRNGDYRYPDRRSPYPQDRQRYDLRDRDEESSGLDRAVDMCVDEVERDRSDVQTVDSANRNAEGWEVRGRLENGSPFTCRLGNDGRIRDIDVTGGQAEAVPNDDRQYDDAVYANARSNAPGTAPGGGVDDRPVWTGDRAQAPADEGDDGRYGVSGTPDFEQVG